MNSNAGGNKVRDHLEIVRRVKGELPGDLEDEELPLCIEHVWNWFMQLHNARGSSGFGPSPILYSEIESWIKLTGASPTRWEIEAIKSLDASFMDFTAKEATKGRGK